MTNDKVFDNFDEANIADIRKKWDEEKKNGTIKRQVYTMVQSNAPCEVEITEESRRLCAEALLK
jgi:predicted transcriptional regulator